jgi:hypothetical protein
MNILNPYILFTVIVSLLAIMDVLNFQMPYNSGFFSLTDGWFDMWHLSKIVILGLMAVKLTWRKEDTRKKNVLKLVALAAIAFFGQLLIYNGIFKLL